VQNVYFPSNRANTNSLIIRNNNVHRHVPSPEKGEIFGRVIDEGAVIFTLLPK
jgi:hypothetical protein